MNMNNALATYDNKTAITFSDDEVSLIKDTICKGATDSELKLFMHQCKATGLNPLARQIYAVKRWDSQLRRESMTTQTSIDGFRLIAERSGKYAGQTEPMWCGKDGQWHDVWLDSTPPAAAKIGILRSDFKEPCWGVARFEAYAQKKKEGDLTRMWQVMGDVMIAKCAEALALRKAFPQELSGLYTSDEMAQADTANISPTNGEVSAKQVFGSAKAMKERWSQIRDILLACKTITDLEKAFLDAKVDFASFKAIDEQLYENLVQIGVQRRNAINETENTESEEAPPFIEKEIQAERERQEAFNG
jgi:phage recombination protein Bet